MPLFQKAVRFKSVREALQAQPMYFMQIIEALGSNDGREIALALESLRREGVLERDSDGRYYLRING